MPTIGRHTRNRALLLALLAMTPAALQAQVRVPVAEVATRVDGTVRPGGVARLVLHVTLPDSVHVQSNAPRDPDLIPTVLSIDAPRGTRLLDITYPRASDLRQAGVRQPLAVYPSEFDIVARVRLDRRLATDTVRIPARLRYQACNDTTCFVPRATEVAWDVRVTAPAAAAAPAARPSALAGLWDAVVVVGGVEVPFRFEIGGTPARLTGTFFDGDVRVPSTSGRETGNAVAIAFDQYGSRIEATVVNGALEGTYDRGTRGAGYPFRARRAAARPAGGPAPSIDGTWIIPTTSSKGEQAFRFLVRQTGAAVSATILRVDGDTGTLTGTYRDGAFVLSHFSGARPLLLEVIPRADGTLDLVQNKQTKLFAIREEAARAANLPAPADPNAHTRVKNPDQPLELAFRDVNGSTLSLADPRFARKAVIVSVTGSWCPNCHDETPFLVELYRRYRARGLEIVALAFEEAAQLAEPARVRAFAKRYGIEYPILLAGEPDALAATLPQFDNLNAFPTSIFIGRDHRVRFVHAGFPSPASGPFYREAQQDIIRQVEQLLAEE